MPVITVTMAEGQANDQQKRDLIEKFTTDAVEITQLPHQAFTILINELSPNAIGVAGKTLREKLRTTEA
jgi:4-oxalocrotonate tautomerase